MAITATKKALSLARVMVDNLTLRLGALSTPLFVAQSTDASGNPLLGIGPTATEAAGVLAGTGTAGHQDAVIKIVPWPSIGSDSLGNAQNSYSPHKIQIVTEASATSGVDVMTEVNKLSLLGEALRTGCTVELYQTANLTAPSPSGIVAANLVATYDMLNNPGTGTM